MDPPETARDLEGGGLQVIQCKYGLRPRWSAKSDEVFLLGMDPIVPCAESPVDLL